MEDKKHVQIYKGKHKRTGLSGAFICSNCKATGTRCLSLFTKNSPMGETTYKKKKMSNEYNIATKLTAITMQLILFYNIFY